MNMRAAQTEPYRPEAVTSQTIAVFITEDSSHLIEKLNKTITCGRKDLPQIVPV